MTPRSGPKPRSFPAKGSSTTGPPPETSGQRPTEAELVARMARGSMQAVGEFYRRLSPLVYSLAFHITRLEEDAEEVLIESFHQAWIQADQYDPARASVEGWILNITRSRAIDKVRSRRRWQHGKQETIESIASFPDTASVSPELEAMRAEVRARLRQVIDSLAQDQRRVIELAYFGGLSHSQIAEHLGQPIGTVKTRLRLAMRKIRAALSGVEGMKT